MNTKVNSVDSAPHGQKKAVRVGARTQQTRWSLEIFVVTFLIVLITFGAAMASSNTKTYDAGAPSTASSLHQE